MKKPIVLTENKNSKKNLVDLKNTEAIIQTLDIYQSQVEELFSIRNPQLNKNSSDYKKQLTQFVKRRKVVGEELMGAWVYFPWKKCLVHMIGPNEYLELRTNRNRELISKEEQQKLYEASVGIIGLSIGGSIASTLAYQCIGGKMGFAEFDTLETTNLNRIRAGILDVGDRKIDILSRQIFEINPFTQLELFVKGLDENNLKTYFERVNPKIIFEAIDNLRMKIILRKEAQRRKVPVVMLTNLGDRVMIDVERYDKESVDMFNGLDSEILEKIVKKEVKPEEINKYVVNLVGSNNIPAKALASVKEVGKTLSGRPQLVSTVTLSGGLATYISRQIILYNTIDTGRYFLKLNEVFGIEEL